jgi:hypothetical protein
MSMIGLAASLAPRWSDVLDPRGWIAEDRPDPGGLAVEQRWPLRVMLRQRDWPIVRDDVLDGDRLEVLLGGQLWRVLASCG